jgi:lambda repressor-like predicted transcriptional regulator
MKAVKRAHRDAQVASMYSRGASLATLEREFGLCERQLRRIIKTQRAKNPRIFKTEAHERVEELLDAHDACIEELALIGLAASTDNARLCAVTAKVRAIDKKRRFLDDLGLLPHFEPPTMDATVPLGKAIVTILRSHSDPSAAEGEILDALVHWHNGSLWRAPIPALVAAREARAAAPR